MRNNFKGALIGDPVDKSISDLTHNALMKLCNIDGFYEKICILKENFEEQIYSLRSSGHRWIAVTMPYKEKIIPYLDVLSPSIEAIGSVNMINNEQGIWIGHNTDGLGALNAIERIDKVAGMNLVLLGAGGTAKAIAYEAKKRGASVFIYNRTSEKAINLATHLGVTQIDRIPENYDCIVNATSVGMFPNSQQLPIKKSQLLKNAILLDVIYSPRKTALIEAGEKIGCKIVLGEEVFAEVSYAQFKIVFGNKIPLMLVRKIVKESIFTRSLR